MKLIQIILISLSVMGYGMPIQAQSQVAPQVFTLPDVPAGEACRINIESVLRDKYRLRHASGHIRDLAGIIDRRLPQTRSRSPEIEKSGRISQSHSTAREVRHE